MIKKVLYYLLLLLMFLGTVAMLYISYVYYNPHVNTAYLKTKYAVMHNRMWYLALYTHILSSVICISCGFVQFITSVRQSYPKVHRILGIIYWIAVLLFAAPSGFILGVFANGGVGAKLSFISTSICWFIFTYLAIRAIYAKQITTHQQHMIRSYALTLSAVSLRFFALILPFIIHLSAKQSYTLIAWLSWIPNLFIAELIIRVDKKL